MGTAKTVVLKHPNKEHLMYEASLSCIPTCNMYIPKLLEENLNSLLPEHIGIVDSGATHLYIAPNAPHGPLDTSTTKIRVVTENGKVATSAEKATLTIPQLAADFPTTGYIMPTFTNTLIGIGTICDTNCTVMFKKQHVIVISPEGKPILQGRREKKLPHLWRFDLKPNDRGKQKYTTTNQKRPESHSVYDLPSIEAIVRYMHATAGFPVKSTWLKAFKNGNYESWPGLTYNNAARYFPHSVETLKGHMLQSPKGLRSTNKDTHQTHKNQKKTPQGKIQQQSETEDVRSQKPPQELHVWDHPIRKL